MSEFKTFTYNKDNPKNSKNLSKNNNNSISDIKEEVLVDVLNDIHIPLVKSMDNFKRSSAKQNEWIRMLFQGKKSIEEIYEQIEEFSLKDQGFQKDSDTGLYTKGGDSFGPKSPQFEHAVNNSEAWSTKRGVESALEFARYFEINKKEGDRLFTNDTIDAANAIDFIQTNTDENGNFDTINLVQIKSSRPQNKSDIDLIQKEHKNYLKNIERITQEKIFEIFNLKKVKENNQIYEKYGNDIFDLMLYLSENSQKEKEENGSALVDRLIKENNIKLSEEDWVYLAFLMSNENDFFGKLKDICHSGGVDILDVNVFKKWLFGKIDMSNLGKKKSIFREYKPNNIASGRKFNSVIYYKEDGRFGKIVLPID